MTPSPLRLAPGILFAAATLTSLAGALAVVFLVLAQPWLGIGLRVDPAQDVVRIDFSAHANLEPGARLLGLDAGGDRIDIRPGDLIEEPDRLDSYGAVTDFLVRQTRIADMIRKPDLGFSIQTPQGAYQHIAVTPAPHRPLADLPLPFWIQVASGCISLLIGAWVFALRRRQVGAATAMFALTGLGLFVSALAAAVYSARELALDGALFRWLSALNHLGVHMFGGAMIALFLVYPRRLVPNAALLAIPAILLPWYWGDITGRLPDPVIGISMPTLMEMTAIAVLIGVQWWFARRNPPAQAAMRWLGLSVLVGAGSFVLIIALPQLLGHAPAMTQGHAFGLFLIIYAGIALGIGQSRLFDLGEWAYRFAFYAGGVALLLALDAVLLWTVDIGRTPAFGVSLLVVGVLYLPLRDLLRRRFLGRGEIEEHELFAMAMKVAFAPTAALRAERWRGLLTRLFDPLEIKAVAQNGAAPFASDDGLELTLPPVASSPALRLRYPMGGKGLFSRRHLLLARQLATLTAEAEDSRAAYERGVAEERQRIARDLHDDVGARLLTGLTKVDEGARPLLHAALSDIRTIVNGLAGEALPLDQALANARHEAARRLETVGIALDWPLAEDGPEGPLLDYRHVKALASTLRELTTNVIRHSGAGRMGVDVRFAAGILRVDIADDGRGLPTDSGERRSGFGLENARRRIEEAGGTFCIVPAQAGVRITISLPVHASLETAPDAFEQSP
ncbi:MAG TPA: ATP-binding protein [Rhizomicrobium sp.]|nr:ATP-binding protein [Rhizomicrobium sp.]